MSRIYDNWERLVETVLRREKLRQLALEHSRSPTVSSISSSFSFTLDEMYWRMQTKEKFLEKRFGRLIPVVDSLDFAVGLEDVLGPSSKFIGKGTFGSTYKLAMDNGVVAVVKRLRGVVVPGRVFEEQMKAIGSIRHQNVASLRAYYFSMYEKLIVYNYFGQGSVLTMLQGKSSPLPFNSSIQQNLIQMKNSFQNPGSRGENSNLLDWETTLRVAIGAARGIAHLHEKFGEKIVHGNIKASNVFLNSEGYGCISEFGLPYMMRASVVRKTAGNYDPVIKFSHQMSQASDVYSFGVLLLELLTRKSHRYYTDGSQFDLVQWVHFVVSKEQPVVISEEELIKYPNVEEQMVKMLRIGISCLNAIPEHRPKMFEVVSLLEDIQRANIPVAIAPNATEERLRLGEITQFEYSKLKEFLSFKLASNDIETTYTLKDDKPEEKTRNSDSSRDEVSTESHQTFEGAVRRGYVNEIEKY
ncbi:UNVERIFIED_CONTAM: putative inactive receptor kinase [Sesamum radiatum]|uniref:Inactive receptor kinase n=1 Tax=Sesamum radiatum TaxID=300843 RepID=A0AAW2TF84_SESRA